MFLRRFFLMLILVSSLLALLAVACRQPPAPAGDPITALKILVAEDGVYQLQPRDLADANFSLAELDPTQLNLTTGGEPVPFVVWEDRLIFYGRAASSRYTPHRVYILESSGTGTTMERITAPAGDGQPIEAVPRRLHLEENYHYASEIPTTAPDGPWFWQPVRGDFTLPVNLPAVHDGSGAITASLVGTTHNPQVENDHSLTLLVNDTPLGDLIWEGQTEFTATLTLPTGILQDGENTLALANIPEDYLDFSNLNWFDLVYLAPAAPVGGVLDFTGVEGVVQLHDFDQEPLILDVQNPDRPVQINNTAFDRGQLDLGVTADMHIIAVTPAGLKSPAGVAPLRDSTLRDTDQQADLLIITTAALAPSLADLVAAREAEGLAVSLALVEEIYDTFGQGEEGPEAIQEFVRYTATEWKAPAPQYVFLVGDATTDYHGYLADRSENPIPRPEQIIPAPLVPVNFSGETVSDSRLVDVDGDTMPDMAIGRWPVNTPAEVAALVARTLAYEQGNPPDRALFAADGSSPEFSQLTEQLINRSTFPASQAEILNGVGSTALADSWNDGAWLVTYTGHGSLELWGKEDVFSVAAVSQLNSETTPPIVLQLTCLSGLFAHPEVRSLSEAMLAHDQGPVLLVGATSLTYSNDQEPFAVGLLSGLQNGDLARIGDVFQQAKLGLDISREGVREVNDTFILFGDPSARVLRP